MTNDEFLMTNQFRNPNGEERMKFQIRNRAAESDERQALCSDFELRASFGFRHSDFVIVQSLTRAASIL